MNLGARIASGPIGANAARRGVTCLHYPPSEWFLRGFRRVRLPGFCWDSSALFLTGLGFLGVVWFGLVWFGLVFLVTVFHWVLSISGRFLFRYWFRVPRKRAFTEFFFLN